jgi:hypothetical protein
MLHQNAANDAISADLHSQILKKLYELINDHRKKMKKPKLVHDKRASEMAEECLARGVTMRDPMAFDHL